MIPHTDCVMHSAQPVIERPTPAVEPLHVVGLPQRFGTLPWPYAPVPGSAFDLHDGKVLVVSIDSQESYRAWCPLRVKQAAAFRQLLTILTLPSHLRLRTLRKCRRFHSQSRPEKASGVAEAFDIVLDVEDEALLVASVCRASEASSNHLRVEVRTERAGPAEELGRVANPENGLDPMRTVRTRGGIHIRYANDRSRPTGSIRAVRLDPRGVPPLILIPIRGTLVRW